MKRDEIRRLKDRGFSIRDIAVIVEIHPHEVREELAQAMRETPKSASDMTHDNVRRATRELVMAVENDPRCRGYVDILRKLVYVGVGVAFERYEQERNR